MARKLGSRIEGLTPRQLECLLVIISKMRESAVPPTVVELADHIGVSRGSVNYLLEVLETKGYIRRAGVTQGHLTLLRDAEGDEVEVIVTIRKKEQQ